MINSEPVKHVMCVTTVVTSHTPRHTMTISVSMSVSVGVGVIMTSVVVYIHWIEA